MPHARGIRTHKDVFTVCLSKDLPFMSRARIGGGIADVATAVIHYEKVNRAEVILRLQL